MLCARAAMARSLARWATAWTVGTRAPRVAFQRSAARRLAEGSTLAGDSRGGESPGVVVVRRRVIGDGVDGR